MTGGLREALNRLRSFFRPEPLDQDMEMAAHLDFATEENVNLGMPQKEARRPALIRLGGVQ